MNYENIIESLKNKQFQKAETLSIEALKNDNLNAQIWLYLAEALVFQGYGASAEAVFKRAWLLDPEAVWIENARMDLQRSDKTRVKEGIDQLLKVDSVSVTAALIVKNESEHIENCLRRIVNAVDEIVIVDTGSTDQTIEISRNFPKVKIIDFQWCDDFAAARNAAFPHITNDWVIWIDADEYLYDADIHSIKEVAGIFHNITAPVLIRVGIMCENDDGGITGKYSVSRMFRMKDKFKFFGKIHEQVVLNENNLYENENIFSRAVQIRFLHHGYKLAEMQKKNKLERNIELLKKMVDENPNDPAWLFFYGRELFNSDRFDESLEILDQCEKASSQYLNFGRILEVYTMIAKILFIKNDYDSAEKVCKKALKEREDFPDILYLLALIHVKRGTSMMESAKEHAKQSKMGFERYRDIVSPNEAILKWTADLLLSDIALFQGRIGDAQYLYNKVLKVCPVQKEVYPKIEFIKSEKQKLISES
ncbi:MAG: glycosyltransferase [Aminipila sp.]